MAWKTVNTAQSMDARSQNAFRRFSNILMSHRNANGNIQYNPQDKSYRLVNDNGIFYSNGRFFSKSGIKGNYNVETGSILNKRETRPSAPSKQQSPTKPKNAVPWKTAPVYPGVSIMTSEDTDYTPSTGQTTFYPTSWKDNEKDFTRVDQQTQGNSAYTLRPNSQTLWKPEGGSNQKESSKSNVTKPQVTKNSKAPTTSTSKPRTNTSSTTSRPRTALAPKTPVSNSWINKGRGIWNYNGVSQTDVANAYKTGDFSKVGSYLSQHKDLASYLNNIYSKRGGNQFNSSTPTKQAAPIQGTPGYGIHVGNGNVTLSTPNGSTTDITNSHNVSTLIDNGNYKAPNLGGMTTNYLENRPLDSYSELTKHNFDRGDIRQGMRANGINPYDYSGSDRKQLKTYLNNPTTDNYTQSVSKIIGDGKIQQNMLNNAVQNQTSQYQLTKPNLGYNPSQNNQLVNLKFEKGGQMYKYSAGAQMVQPQQASGQQGIEQQAMTLVQAAMQGDQQANQTIQKIMQAAQQGDQQAAQVAKLLQAIVQQMKGSRKARLGAKLDYIKQSIGECPEGQEVVYFKKGGEICKICAGKKMQDGGKSDPIKNFKKKKDVAKQTYQRNPYTRGKSAKEIAEMQRRNRQEASAGKGENDANVAPWNYKKKKMK